MDDFLDFVIPALLIVVVFAGMAGLIFVPTYYLSRAACFASTEKIGYPADYGFLSGCRINVEGRLVPLENYRTFEATP